MIGWNLCLKVHFKILFLKGNNNITANREKAPTMYQSLF